MQGFKFAPFAIGPTKLSLSEGCVAAWPSGMATG